MGTVSTLQFIETIVGCGRLAEQTDSQLINHYIFNKNRIAFEILVQRHGGAVLRIAYRAFGNQPDSDEVFQTTFIALAKELTREKSNLVASGRPIAPWLHKVARHAIARIHRTHNRRSSRELKVAIMRNLESSESPEDQAIQEETFLVLTEEIQKLGSKYRDILMQCVIAGSSIEEAAEFFGIPEGTVKSRLHEAKKQLRERLQRKGIGQPGVDETSAMNKYSQANPNVPPMLATSVSRIAWKIACGSVVPPGQSIGAGAMAEGILIDIAHTQISYILYNVISFINISYAGWKLSIAMLSASICLTLVYIDAPHHPTFPTRIGTRTRAFSPGTVHATRPRIYPIGASKKSPFSTNCSIESTVRILENRDRNGFLFSHQTVWRCSGFGKLDSNAIGFSAFESVAFLDRQGTVLLVTPQREHGVDMFQKQISEQNDDVYVDIPFDVAERIVYVRVLHEAKASPKADVLKSWIAKASESASPAEFGTLPEEFSSPVFLHREQ